MSIAFMGNVVRGLQELGVDSITPLIGVVPRLDIYPGHYDRNPSYIGIYYSSIYTSISISNRFDLHTHFEA
jgi:hypothetical protein